MKMNYMDFEQKFLLMYNLLQFFRSCFTLAIHLTVLLISSLWDLYLFICLRVYKSMTKYDKVSKKNADVSNVVSDTHTHVRRKKET